ncbi:MarR family winged helix-turn-helix transcriptional regulator [Georgenia muralis]|uniref:DNA-binding MarR family transcriptional regulator n=1 Tax=Georgenia muralis TaxID=154117 RepID=A0A3N4Z1G4_9MICO|nr:MarR family transcriptional regulator [Georgenia muralis]RPF27099.1 DNA-binding MarR family transcriptional regulator [Georgenia muralis]
MSESRRPEASARVLDQIAALGRRSRTSSVLVAQLFGLHATQVQLLFALHRASECRVASLAEVQMVDPSVASRQAAVLEKAGLIARRPDPEDGRASLVSLTDAGRARVAELRALHVRAVGEALSTWPVERIERLAGDLADLVAVSGEVYARLADGQADGSAARAPVTGPDARVQAEVDAPTAGVGA